MNCNVVFNGRETLLNTATKEAKKVVSTASHEYNSNSMLGLVEKKTEVLKDEVSKLTEAYKAKYAPYSVEQKASTEMEELTEAYKRARGL